MRSSSRALRVAPAGSSACTAAHSSRSEATRTGTPSARSKSGVKVRRLHAPTTAASSRCSRTAARMACRPSARQPKGTDRAATTPGSREAYSHGFRQVDRRRRCSPRIRRRTRRSAARAATGSRAVSTGGPRGRRGHRSPGTRTPAAAAAPAWATLSAMSAGPAAVPATKMPGRPVSDGVERRRAEEPAASGESPAAARVSALGGGLGAHGQHDHAEALLGHLPVLRGRPAAPRRAWRGLRGAPRAGSARDGCRARVAAGRRSR